MPTAAVAALNAGCDLLYVSGDAAAQQQAYQAVLLAVRHGSLPESRVADAVIRVLALKRSYRLI